MDVSLAAVSTANILVFGKRIDKNKTYNAAGSEIIQARTDWKKVMRVCASLTDANSRNKFAADYPELATLAAHQLGGKELLQFAIRKYRAEFECFADHDDAAILREMQPEFDRLHPYGFCKKHGLLIDNSGEEFALQFMAAFNDLNYLRY